MNTEEQSISKNREKKKLLEKNTLLHLANSAVLIKLYILIYIMFNK